MADAVGTTVGGALGTSSVTTYIESASGVEEGGRTGLTAVTVAVLFLFVLAFVPLATMIPLYASHIAFVVIAVVMPFTFNIGYGIAVGIVSYPVVKAAAGEFRDVSALQWALAGLFVVYFVVRTGGYVNP